MSTSFSPMGKEMCSKQDIQKTTTGYVSDSVCGFSGVSITSHAEITGDFNSAYTVKSTSHSERGPAGMPRDSSTTIEAKWLGACKGDQKAVFLEKTLENPRVATGKMDLRTVQKRGQIVRPGRSADIKEDQEVGVQLLMIGLPFSAEPTVRFWAKGHVADMASTPGD